MATGEHTGRTVAPGAQFIDPLVLARIDSLLLVARTVVHGFINGLHRSPFLGLSVDFAEHRPYMPGDDIRRIDWRLYARTDRHYVKEFEAETNADFLVVVDASRSMDYASTTLSKFDYARYLAASLTYFSHLQRDRVGTVVVGEGLQEYVPCAARHLEDVLYALDRARPEARPRTPLSRSLHKVAELASRRGIIAILSDGYEEAERILAAVGELAFRGHEVIVFHLLDEYELTFPFEDPTLFQDLESGEQLPIVPRKARERYTERLQAHVDRLKKGLGERGADFVLLDTSVPLDFALFRYLSERERLRRVR